MMSLLGVVVAQLIHPCDVETIIAILLVFVAVPLGLLGGLQLASRRRDELADRLCKSERVLVVLGFVNVAGFVVGLLGDGQMIPMVIGVLATFGSMLCTAWLVLRTPASADRARQSRRHRNIV